MFSKVMIANRGVAAVRIAHTLRAMGITSVGLRSDAEAEASYFSRFDELCDLGAGTVAETYLNTDLIVQLAVDANVQAIHPGYGFLSENAEFAKAVHEAGMVFIGPSPNSIELFGLKHTARKLALDAGLGMLPGTSLLADVNDAITAARAIGYPVILKSTAGGGGIGMQRCDDEQALVDAYASVRALAQANFSSAGMFLEKCLDAPRHVEVQVFGDGKGEVLVLGDRDCSMQRRNQKVVEECPAPDIPDTVRTLMHEQAATLAQSIQYASAGTVEFLYDSELEQPFFLEVNTRLQVEHAVTEMVWGIDLVEWMVRLAAGEVPWEGVSLSPQGHAIQARWYAEDPYRNFTPSPGVVDFTFAGCARLETWVEGRTKVPHLFDPMLANVICHATDRLHAIEQLRSALDDMQAYGIATNRDYLLQALDMPAFKAEQVSTNMLASLVYQPMEVEVLSAGLETTLQSYPGRQGLWEVGVPPSGPMDDLSFRVGNKILGNPQDAVGLEILFSGPSLQFRNSAQIIVVGASVDILLDDEPIAHGVPFNVKADQILKIGQIVDGLRCYLCIAGGFEAKSEHGSTATFTLGQMGGHAGRALRVGDLLKWRSLPNEQTEPTEVTSLGLTSASETIGQRMSDRTSIRMLLGPHGAPDYFEPSYMEEIFSEPWRVHHNSSRTGVRFIGPQPKWVREDGGEAGLHPSNIHDNAYAFGALDFTGDMPVILGPDGPSLGGFVCPAVVINADRWKLGQLQPGDSVEFKVVSELEAQAVWDQQIQSLQYEAQSLTQSSRQGDAPDDETLIEGFGVPLQSFPTVDPTQSPVLHSASFEVDAQTSAQTKDSVDVMIRRAGQEWLLVEFGQPVLDIATRLIVHRLMAMLAANPLKGVIEMTPGVRSLQIRYDFRMWRASALIDALQPFIQAVIEQSDDDAGGVSSRVVHMPLSWDDPACQLAVERYVSSVRADAPWCPDNIDFIRRINGLSDAQAVKDIVFDASYLVLGLGDVYLGAPVATPLDPRHRLVTTKYNPARTWTAQNSVGIGGSYMCIYGMEGPGGYQFIGRTVPVWRSEGFACSNDNSWLLNHFDQIRYYEVDAQELLEIRTATERGAFTPQIEETQFNIVAYRHFLDEHADSINSFTNSRTIAFKEEMERWRAAGLDSFVADEATTLGAATDSLDHTQGFVIESPIAASVWRLTTQPGERARSNDELILLEAMKAEFSVKTPVEGCVEYLVSEGQVVEAGQPLAIVS